MNYENVTCDGCGKQFEKGDDIVVCPECGTPQHRECYNKNNCCVNSARHAEGFEWQSPVKKEEKKPEPETHEEEKREAIPKTSFDGERFENIYLNRVGYDPKDDIGGATVREAAVYVQVNSHRYIRKFMKSKKRKSGLSWNWGAFFFPSSWFFFRKLYKVGLIFLCLISAWSVSLNVAFSSVPGFSNYSEYALSVSEKFSEIDEKYGKGASEEKNAELQKLYTDFYQKTNAVLPSITAFFVLAELLPRFIAALSANKLYKKKIVNDISFARKGSEDKSLIRLSIIGRGGVSFTAGALAQMAAMYLPELLYYIATSI